VFVEKPLEEFKINIIDTSICNKNLKFTSYFITQRNYSICNEDLGEYSVPWCHIHPSMEFPTLFACTFNSDYSSFDGVTYVDGIDPQTHNFNSCTPDGYFFEMTGPLGTRIFDNVKFDTISGLFQHPNFIYQDVEENDFLNQECLPSECAHGDNFKSFEEYRLIYELEPDWAFPDDIMMHNFIDSDTELVGVITNYRDTEFKVRYRVPKI